MKIAQVVCVYPPYKGGIGNCARDFSNINGSIEQTVITPKYNYVQKQNEPGVIRLRPFLQFGNAALLPQLAFKLRDFDLVHLHYPFFGGSEFALLAKMLYGRRFKLIVHYHMDTAGLPWIKKIFTLSDRITKKWLLKKADLITCASLDYVKESEIKNFYLQNNHKFRELPFGVDITRFRPSVDKKSADGLKMLFLGGLDKAHYFKGLDVLFKALTGLKNEKWSLDIVGGGGLQGKYKKMANTAGLAEKINFPGRMSDGEIPKIFRNSDLFVFPSINSHEAFGKVLLEAMASGVPALASRLPGVRKVFSDGREGWYFQPGNHKDLRGKIIKAINEREKLKKMGLAARLLAEDKYDWEKIRPDLKKIYEDLPDK